MTRPRAVTCAPSCRSARRPRSRRARTSRHSSDHGTWTFTGSDAKRGAKWAMLLLPVRRLPRLQLHVDLTILATLAHAFVKADMRRFAA